MSVVDESGLIQAVFERRSKDRHMQANRTELIQWAIIHTNAQNFVEVQLNYVCVDQHNTNSFAN